MESRLNTIVQEGFTKFNSIEGIQIPEELDLSSHSKYFKDSNYSIVASALFHRFKLSSEGEKSLEERERKENENICLIMDIVCFLEANTFYDFFKEQLSSVDRSGDYVQVDAEGLIKEIYISFMVWNSIRDYVLETPELDDDTLLTPDTELADLGLSLINLQYLRDKKHPKYNGVSVQERTLHRPVENGELIMTVDGSVSDLIDVYIANQVAKSRN